MGPLTVEQVYILICHYTSPATVSIYFNSSPPHHLLPTTPSYNTHYYHIMSVIFVGLDEIKSAIADVRDDRTATNWALLSYEGENTNNVVLLGKGEDGPNELIEQLQDNILTQSFNH